MQTDPPLDENTMATRSLLHVAPPRVSERALEVWNKAKKNGWAVIVTRGSTSESIWGYTVGLDEHFNHPEVLVSALSPENTVNVLNVVGKAVKAGARFDLTAEKTAGIFKTVQVRFAPIHPELIMSHLNYCELFGPLWETRAIEMIWPDPMGKFFDEKGYKGGLSSRQLLLSEKMSLADIMTQREETPPKRLSGLSGHE